MKLKNLAGLFGCGSVGYAALEMLWRGRTHWSMALTGGTVFVAMAQVHRVLRRTSLLEDCVAGAALITMSELMVGMVVNAHYHLHVWDYSDQRLNLCGQICAKYMLLWFLLSAPAMRLAAGTDHLLRHP